MELHSRGNVKNHQTAAYAHLAVLCAGDLLRGILGHYGKDHLIYLDLY